MEVYMNKSTLINRTVSWLCAVSLAAGASALPNAAFAADVPVASSESVSVPAAEQYTITQDGVTFDKPLDASIFDTMSGTLESGNYVLTDDIIIPENKFFTISGGSDVKIHLNGHKIECNNSLKAFDVTGGELTVTDSEDGTKGSIISSGNVFTMSSPQASTINLYNVSYISGKSTIYSASGSRASINIYSGEFSPKTASDDFLIVETFVNCPTTLNVSGGKFNGIIAKPYDENNTPYDLDITITGGLFPSGTLIQEGLNWDSNGEYKAAYNFVEKMYEVSYYGTEYFLNGHGVTPTPQRVKYGEPLIEPEKPTDPDWAFAGWFRDKECTDPFDFEYFDTALQFKLYAKWEAKAISSIEIATPPTKTTYKEGDTFDLTGLVVTAIYNTGDTVTVPYEGNEADFSFDPAGKLTPSDTEVEISYLGKFTAEQPITVEPKQLQSVTLAKGSMKVSYFLNDSYLIDGVEVLLTYDNGDTETVRAIENRDSFSFSPAAFQTSGDVDVTIYYLGYEMTEQVYVFPEAVSFVSVKTPPTKTSYYVGETFDPTGLVLDVLYNSGRTAEAPYESGNVYYTYSPDGELTLTDTQIEIFYYGKTTTVDITVSEKPNNSGGNSGGSSGSYGRRDSVILEDNPLIDGKQSTWSDVKDLMKKGDAALDLNGINSVPSDVIQAVKDSGNMLILLDGDNVRWTIDGAKLTSVHAADVTLIKTLSQYSYGLSGTEAVQFSANGTDNAELTLTLGNADKFANVYLTKDGKRSFAGVYRIDANGEIRLNITDKGDYIVMVSDLSGLKGDADNDGKLGVSDALAALRQAIGLENAANQPMADYNGDGLVNIKDALEILRASINL